MLKKPRAASSPALQYFGDSRSRSIWQWQLIIGITVLAIGLGVALMTPARFGDWRFSVGVFAILALTMISLAIPWHRFGNGVVFVLPLLDTLAIALIALGDTAAATFLWVFPVAWVASYYSVGILIGLMSLIAILRITNLFLLGLTVETTINMVILLITLSFVGVSTSVGAERNRSSRRLLRGQSDRLAHALQRVNEQKARTRRLLDSLDIGIARVGAGGVLEVSNRAFHAIFDIELGAHSHPTRAVEYRTRRGEPVPNNETSIARASRGELFADEIVWLFGIDGQWRAVKTSTKQIDHGTVTDDGLLLIVEDVTASIDPQAGQEATRRSISHELRNPLTAILGHIDLLLERDDLLPSVRDQLDVVEHAGTRMQTLIDQALATPGKREEAGVEFDLADVARASVEAFSPAADTAGVTVDVRLDEPLCVCGDAFRLRQVVDNLVGNAIKYAQRGGRVSVQGLRPTDHEVGLRISDTGIGIAAEDLPRIFEREFRTQAARDSGIPGTGLGLHISHNIVIAQGGRMEVVSEPGQGTELTVILPALQRNPSEEHVPFEGERA
ncbi:HAMP domain-containing sensor histidine kinase [Microbacterium paludicola]|uniref:sensor histidine kinase n=1 Tax=Microbacterium paludicola TaxID=300019 RepID=UPI0011A75E6A|nr:HAMP domain-containing sensor histidine kinase [Microbacterium paludicola]